MANIERWVQLGEFGGIVIKWSRNLKRRLKQKRTEPFDEAKLRRVIYRPYVKLEHYDSKLFVDERGQAEQAFPLGAQNRALCISFGPRLNFSSIASDSAPSYSMYTADPCQYFPFMRTGADSVLVDNITDWALKQFATHYTPASGSRKDARSITKQAIFHYCYAVLHDPLYRDKYAQNLKREFPRIPFYADFWQWAAWGEALMALHIGYETVAPFALTRTDTPDDKARAAGLPPKALLRADTESGSIVLDSETTLRGIPAHAWLYKLGNRSALDWVLDQYKEKKPKDPTIREKFDTYRFADYKEKVIDLLMRVTTVSVETVRVTQAMQGVVRTN